jgi:hypothetical protein
LGIMDRIITGTGAKIRSVFLYGLSRVVCRCSQNIKDRDS